MLNQRHNAYALFLDESGHDHKELPYEVRGGVVLRITQLFSFVEEMQLLERAAFGDLLHRFGSEIKGYKLLDKDRFRFAAQAGPLAEEVRRRMAKRFLEKGARRQQQSRIEFTAYGQACLFMAKGVLDLLERYQAKLFAAAVPRGVRKPETFEAEEFLRKDQVFLLERFYYFLQKRRAPGLIVADETDKVLDRRFFGRLQRYFTRTLSGRERAQLIVPAPFFVSSDMSYPVQAADLCLYCINWGFRLPSRGMNADVREEIAQEFGPRIRRLQFSDRVVRPGEVFETYSIFYVPDPYVGRQA
jgi:hypothetical protein